jgi:flagellar biosynthesis protein FlhF
MRLRSFTGKTMGDALAQVRQHLGDDAVIVATQEDEDGSMRVTAALDQDRAPSPLPPESDVIDTLDQALAGHGLSADLTEKILTAALAFADQEPVTALSSALAALFPFRPIGNDKRRSRFLLAGPPGAGKTVTAAKLAARVVRAGGPVRLISADAARAGASEQLAAFARILRVPIERAEGVLALRTAAASVEPGETLIIDTAGINPYGSADRDELDALIEAGGAEPVLVLPTGSDTVDAVDMARIFAEHGCSRVILTRIDIARRLGSALAAADAAALAFAEAGIAAAIADGLSPFNPALLARMLLASAVRTRRPSLASTR